MSRALFFAHGATAWTDGRTDDTEGYETDTNRVFVSLYVSTSRNEHIPSKNTLKLFACEILILGLNKKYRFFKHPFFGPLTGERCTISRTPRRCWNKRNEYEICECTFIMCFPLLIHTFYYFSLFSYYTHYPYSYFILIREIFYLLSAPFYCYTLTQYQL